MSRPSKLTEQTKIKLFKALQSGASDIDAARYAGISVRTLAYWKEKGESSKSGQYFQFLQEYHGAKSQGAVGLLGLLLTAAKNGDTKAAMFLLEVSHGYSRNRDKNTINIQVNAENMNVQTLMQEVREGSLKLLESTEPPMIDLDEE
jgi:hypothetical protein